MYSLNFFSSLIVVLVIKLKLSIMKHHQIQGTPVYYLPPPILIPYPPVVVRSICFMHVCVSACGHGMGSGARSTGWCDIRWIFHKNKGTSFLVSILKDYNYY